jgi:hypothetical protein
MTARKRPALGRLSRQKITLAGLMKKRQLFRPQRAAFKTRPAVIWPVRSRTRRGFILSPRLRLLTISIEGSSAGFTSTSKTFKIWDRKLRDVMFARFRMWTLCGSNLTAENSDLLVRLLEEAGVRWVFGIPSGPVLPFIESLGRSPVQFILTASETSAGFMAATVGYLTGIPGVCVSTLGPGATNLATGVGCAWLDRSPVIAITCNVATRWLERHIQMRIDHHTLFKPLTKATVSLARAYHETSRN